MNDLVFVNNSRETFTTSQSGAIATCISELARCAVANGVRTRIITRAHADRSLIVRDWSQLTVLPPRKPERRGVLGLSDRVRRRLTGWGRPDQWQFAREVVDALKTEVRAPAVVNNDPELAVHLRRAFPDRPVIHWFHNLEMASDRYRREFARDRGITSVAVSGYLARAVEQIYGMTPGAVRASLNGIDASLFLYVDRPNRTPVVGFLGRVAVEKGVDIFLEAALLLARRGLTFEVQLVGDTNWGGRQTNSYSDKVDLLLRDVRANGIPVHAFGHVEHSRVAEVLVGADIHVMPSRWDEPCGLALMEGMASGQAVVAAACDGIPEVVATAGALVPREDPVAFADALEPLILSPELRVSAAARARERAGLLTWEASWSRMRDVILTAQTTVEPRR